MFLWIYIANINFFKKMGIGMKIVHLNTPH